MSSLSLSAPCFKAGYHRLKTTTGCLTCRQRRKKCDELKPTCNACSRNRLACNWPCGRAGARRYRRAQREKATFTKQTSSNSESLESSEILSICQLPIITPSTAVNFPTGLMGPTPLHEGVQDYVTSYCLNFFLPFQVHWHPGVRPTDQSYLISMSLQYPPLMGTLLANAALTLGPTSKKWQSFAIEKYVSAVRDIRLSIMNGSLTGKEDKLLATIMWLCIFENSRLDVRCSKSGTHLLAYSKILEIRDSMDQAKSSQPALLFERICVEYYVYHSAIITLFDRTIEPAYSIPRLQAKYPACLTSYEDGSLNEILHSPVLGAPYQLFGIIIEATQLARSSTSRMIEAKLSAIGQYSKLAEWQSRVDEEANGSIIWAAKLYTLAARILLLKVISSEDEPQVEVQRAELASAATQGLKQLSIQPLGGIFGKYWLWPFAVFGSIMRRTEDINLIRDKIDVVARRSMCSAIIVVKHLLESIWARKLKPEDCNYCLEGLAILLDHDIMDNTSSVILPEIDGKE